MEVVVVLGVFDVCNGFDVQNLTLQILEGHRNVVSCLAKSHSGAYIASGKHPFINKQIHFLICLFLIYFTLQTVNIIHELRSQRFKTTL